MSLDNLHAVDAISTDKLGTTITLTIFDALDWGEEGKHLLALQNKLNTYFSFIQSGQILESYPNANGKQLCIELVTPAPIPPKCIELLRRADLLAQQLNVRVGHRVQIASPNPQP